MSEIIDKLKYLQDTKALIMEVLKDKNVDVLEENTFRSYVSLMLNGLQGIRKSSFVRPSDWLAMPTVSTTETKVACLLPIYNNNENYVTINCSPAYNVDWGDGNSYNGAASQMSHSYTYSSISDSTLTSEGFKQVIVTITPSQNKDNSYTPITSIILNGTHVSAKVPNQFIDILGNDPNVTNLKVSNLTNLRIFSFGKNAITDFSNMFYNCISLQDVPLLDKFAGSNYSVVMDYVGLAHNHDTLYAKSGADKTVTFGTVNASNVLMSSIGSASDTITLLKSIIPTSDNSIDLGTSTLRFKNVYAAEVHVGASSLYVNGKQVISDVSDTMTFSTEADKSMNIKTTGAGIISLLSDSQINANAAGGLEWKVPATNPSKNINFTNLSTSGNISFASANQIILNASDTVVANNITVTGNLTVSGTNTVVNTEQLTIKDNMITLNSNQTGTPPTSLVSGIDINRGDAGNYRFVFDELTDTFRVGQVGSLQPVATREDTPITNGVAYWDNTNNKMVTSSNLAFDGSSLTVSSKRVVAVTSAAAFPTSPVPGLGDMCYRTDLDELYFYQGAVWIQI